MKVQVGICDNDQQSVVEVNKLLEIYFQKTNLQAHVSPYSTPDEILNSNNIFDVCFIDVNFCNSINGIELGKKLLERNANCKLVYISHDTTQGVQAFNLNAVDYLQKPVDLEQFLLTCFKVRARCNNQFKIIQTKAGEMKVNLRNLTYVETYGRCARYHFIDKTHLDTISLRTSFEKEIDPLQKNSYFIMVGPSLLINLVSIRILNKDHAVLSNGEFVYFPKSSYKQLREAWANCNLPN